MISVRDEIEKYIEKHNLIFGICDAEKLNLENKKTPFVTTDIEYRTNPKLTLSSAKSIVVVGMNYKKKILPQKGDKLRSSISIGAIGVDYHIVMNKHLNNITEILEGHENKAFVDTGPLAERALAKKAGLGWQGKNGNIISCKFGSFFFIGYIITSLELETSRPYNEEDSKCGACTKCANACPSGILHEVPKNYFKCVSYLTQHKGDLADYEASLLGNSIYGCDICQMACPHNRNTPFESDAVLEATVEIEEFLNLTKKEFNVRYGDTAMAWRGFNTLKRNAIIALANSENKSAISILEKYLNAQSEVVSHAANKAYNYLKNL